MRRCNTVCAAPRSPLNLHHLFVIAVCDSAHSPRGLLQSPERGTEVAFRRLNVFIRDAGFRRGVPQVREKQAESPLRMKHWLHMYEDLIGYVCSRALPQTLWWFR